jgi:hypothetical protein
MLVRSLPTIEASPEFMSKLNARLQQMEPMSATDYLRPRSHVSATTVAALAAGLAAVGYVAVEAIRRFEPESAVRLPPAVASMPDAGPAPLGTAAFVTSVPTGMPIWSAVLMVGQAPQNMANMDFRENTESR